jgi:hypothetical protein
MVMGAQGGVWAVNFWMPTYLRTVRHLSATGTGLYVAVQAFGALIGFLLGAYLADAIGRKWTFMISAIATIIMVLVYLYVPVGDTGLLLLGIPLNARPRPCAGGSSDRHRRDASGFRSAGRSCRRPSGVARGTTNQPAFAFRPSSPEPPALFPGFTLAIVLHKRNYLDRSCRRMTTHSCFPSAKHLG